MGKNRCKCLICILLVATLVSCKNEVKKITLHNILFEKTLHQNNKILFLLDSLHFFENNETEIQLSIEQKPISSTGDFGELHILTHALLIEKNHIEAEKKYKTILKGKSKLHPLTALLLAEYELKNSIPVSGKHTLKEIEKGTFPDYYKGLSAFCLGKIQEEENHQIDGARVLYEKALAYFQKTDHITPAHQECVELLTIHSTYQRKNLMAIRYANMLFDFNKYVPACDSVDKAKAYANRAFMMFREDDFEGTLEDIKTGMSFIDGEKNPETFQSLMKSSFVANMIRGEEVLFWKNIKNTEHNINKTGIDFIDVNRWKAQFLYSQNKFDEAIPFGEKSFKKLVETKKVYTAKYSTMCYLLSQSYLMKGDYKTSLQYMFFNREKFTDFHPDTMMSILRNDTLYAFSPATECANIYYHQFLKSKNVKSLFNANTFLTLVDTLLYHQMEGVEENVLLQFYVETGKQYFDLGLSVNYHLYEATRDSIYLQRFFEYSEKRKNSLLYKDILMAKKESNIPPELAEKELHLRSQIKEEKRKGLRSNHRFNSLMDEYVLLEKEIENRMSKPSEFSLLEGLQNVNKPDLLLSNNQNLLIVDETDSVWYFTTVIDRKLRIIAKSVSEDDIQSILKFVKHCSEHQDSNIFSMSKTVKNHFFPKEINGNENKNWVIIPDGIYHRLPLKEMFCNGKNNVKTFPSLRVWNSLDKVEKQKPGKEVAIFAFSDLETIRDKKRTYLTELPGTYKEAQKIKKEYPDARWFSGKKATKKNFLKVYKDPNVGYIHLALHGKANSVEKDDVKLYFRTEDGGLDSLYGYELLRYRSACKKVSLSACSSGLGKYISGEGTYSLPRYFMLNGANEVNYNLWDVED